MQVRDWTVCLIEPNKFEAQILIDVLRNAGVDRLRHFTDNEDAAIALELYPANIIIAALETSPVDAVAWTRAFRRNMQAADRKAPIFVTARTMSRVIAEDCRHGGVNALIGKPLSAQTLLTTIKKVLANPRPFIDAPGYVGPCRRAGIVTAEGVSRKRRQADQPAKPVEPLKPALLAAPMTQLAAAIEAYLRDATKHDACIDALRQAQAAAAAAGDGPLIRACAALALQLGADDVPADAAKLALAKGVDGVRQLTEAPSADAAAREAIAEGVRQAVAKAASQRAA